MALPERLRGRLRLAPSGAPMFVVSRPELGIATYRAGILGAFPASNPHPLSALDRWIGRLRERPDSGLRYEQGGRPRNDVRGVGTSTAVCRRDASCCASKPNTGQPARAFASHE